MSSERVCIYIESQALKAAKKLAKSANRSFSNYIETLLKDDQAAHLESEKQ